MTKTSDSDLIKAFIESQNEAKKPMAAIIIDKFGRDNFMQQAISISNSITDSRQQETQIPHPFQTQSERLAFYAENRTDYMAWFLGALDSTDANTLNLLSMLLWGEDEASTEEINRVFILDDSSSDNYDRFIDLFVISSLENICPSFEGFVFKYKDENEFFDIDIELGANLSVEAKHLLLSGVPTLTVMNDGSVRDAIGVIHDKHKTLEDILYLVRRDGYNDGYLARSEEDEDYYEN